MFWVRSLFSSYRCATNLHHICSALASCSTTAHVLSCRTVTDKAPFLTNLSLSSCRRRALSSEGSSRGRISSRDRRCWSCGAFVQLFFCSSCQVIQPPDQKANYFEMFNCDQIFALDTQRLQRRYVELQRSLHPDNFSQKSQAEQKYSEEQSALVNEAYRTLQKPLSRSAYMLQLRGVELNEGTDDVTDPTLLLQLMEFNENLAESRSLDEVHAMGQEVRATLQNLTEQMNASLNKGDLQSARELLTRMKYFTNLEERVKEKVAENL